jgi:hypothetical protein
VFHVDQFLHLGFFHFVINSQVVIYQFDSFHVFSFVVFLKDEVQEVLDVWLVKDR